MKRLLLPASASVLVLAACGVEQTETTGEGDELADSQDALTAGRFETFTGQDGKIVPLKDTIRGFKGILSGEFDSLPEQAFYMVGSIEEAVAKAKTLQ